jgi:radical SAM protein with 4Fe4S-binding SPASM domain
MPGGVKRPSARQLGVFTNSRAEPEFLRARDVGRKLGLRVIVSGASLDRLTSWFCGAMVIPSFALCLNGTVTACHRDHEGRDYGYGHLTPGVTSTFQQDESRLRELELLATMPQACNDCFAKFHCAGDCPDLRRSGGSRCNFQRAVLFAQLRELFGHNEKGENCNGC